MAGEEVERERAEGEHVQPYSVGVALPHPFRGLKGANLTSLGVALPAGDRRQAARRVRCGIRAQPRQNRTRTRARDGRACALPIAHHCVNAPLRRRAYPHGLGQQAAVYDTVPVGVAHGLGDLAQHIDPPHGCNPAILLGEPEVQPSLPFVHRIHQTDAQLRLHEIQRPQDPLVGEPGEHLELPPGPSPVPDPLLV